jgi:predicted TIM-barrel fold metal-dependent hydrolase
MVQPKIVYVWRSAARTVEQRKRAFRRYNNTEMLQIAAQNSDVLIPFVSIDPHKAPPPLSRPTLLERVLQSDNRLGSSSEG